jgi:hypothetical protein
MLIPPTTTPNVKGPENTKTGGHALAGMSESNSNPNRRQAPWMQAPAETGEEAKTQESQKSRLIDRSPISSATQAALLALLSEPFAGSEGGNSFAELVEEATLEQSAAEDQRETTAATEGDNSDD